jgi:hypothetical protein
MTSDLWPQLFSDVNCIALWISSEKILTRLYSVLHWFHKRLEANVKNPRENRCFQTIIVFSFGSFYNSNKCTVLWKIAASLITVSTSVNKEMWVKLSDDMGNAGPSQRAGRSTRSFSYVFHCGNHPLPGEVLQDHPAHQALRWSRVVLSAVYQGKSGSDHDPVAARGSAGNEPCMNGRPFLEVPSRAS